MNNMRSFIGWLLLLLAVALPEGSAVAQSNNLQAQRWFATGVKETDVNKKIAAYASAIAADPDFVEALYNLGLAYRQKQDYAKVEEYLLRASQARPEAAAKELRAQILFELAMVYKKRDRADRAEAALQQAKGLAKNNKIAGIITAELGRFFYEQKRYEAALAEFRASVRLNPENESKFANMIEVAQTAVEVQRLYDRAEQAAQRGDLAEAKKLFEQVRAGDPQFKDVAARLADLNARQKQAETRQAEASPRPKPEANKTETAKDSANLYETAKRLEAEGDREQALATYEKLVAQSAFYEDARTRLQDLKQKMEEERLNSQLEEKYTAGMAALKAQDWTRAIIVFEQIIAANRDFRETRRRLSEAQNGLERESIETVAARFYAEGVAASKRNDWGTALAAFEKVRRINPNYRDVAYRLAEIERAMAQQTAAGTVAAAPPVATAPTIAAFDSLYQTALAAMVKEDWMQAAVALEKLQVLRPNYRDVADLLARTRVHLNLATKTETATVNPVTVAMYFGGALMVALIGGAILSSPAVRARLHLWRGNRSEAEAIYEQILARHPQRLGLYPQLAELYLHDSRQDEFAMKVYKKALQGSLPDQQRKAIRSFITQNYLDEGKQNGDVHSGQN